MALAPLESAARLLLKLGHVIVPALALLVLADHRRVPCFEAGAEGSPMPHLVPGYACPSGHMHAVCFFYGSLFLDFAILWFRAAAVALMARPCASTFRHARDVVAALELAALWAPAWAPPRR
jgi:hypothetical protein